MKTPVVLALGVGEVGTAIMSWSATKHLRQIHYAVADADPEILARSGITNQILLRPSSGTEGAKDELSLVTRGKLSRALAGADICVIVAAVWGETDGVTALAMAELAKQANVPCVCICVLPAPIHNIEARARSSARLNGLATLCDVVFLVPLERLFIGPFETEVAGPQSQDVFEYVDRLIQLCSAPRLVNLMLRSVATRTRTVAEVGLYRRILLQNDSEDLVAALSEELATDPFVFEEQFADAHYAAVIVQTPEGPTPTLLADLAAGLSAILPPTADLELVGRANGDCGEAIGIELLSLSSAPANLSAWTRAASPVREWKPFMPWLDRTIAPPMRATFEGLFGTRFVPMLDEYEYGNREPAFRGNGLFGQFLRSPRGQSEPFPDGSTLEWLDKALTRSEALVASCLRAPLSAVWRFLTGKLSLRDGVKQARSELSAAWHRRQGSPLWDLRSLVALVALVAIPFGAAHLGLTNLEAMARAGRANSGAKIDVLDAFKQADKFRITAASKQAAVTRGVYETMGLAATFPSAQASHLDLWAIDENYLDLFRFTKNVPPYTFVRTNNLQDSGLNVVFENLSDESRSPAKALYALGLFPDYGGFASLAGESPAEAASELYAVDADAGGGGNLDTVVGLAGCNTIRIALAKHFKWKKLAPIGIDLTNRHYFLALALGGPASCRTGLDKAFAAANLLQNFANIAYVRYDPEGSAKTARYDVVVPVEIAAEPKFEGDLGLYMVGLRAFYLLDFAAAEASFDQLSKSNDANAATLGAFLEARVIFWRREFKRGSYRPDLFAPWRCLTSNPDCEKDTDPGEKVNAEAQEGLEAGDVPDCETPADAKTCRQATLYQPSDEVAADFSPAEAQRITAILRQVEKNPILSLGFVRGYLGADGRHHSSAGEADEEAPE